GLVICKSLVEAMKGEIGVTSIKDVGSKFWFELPLEQTDQALPENRNYFPQIEQIADLKGKRILVAEDNVTNQMIVREYLNRAGCLVDVANNGHEALKSYQKGDYDLILMDISMPELDGFETCREIRALGGAALDVPVIAFTAYADAEDQDEAANAGMNGYIPKPFTEKQLLGTLLRHIKPATGDTVPDLPKHDEQQASEFDHELVASLFEGLDEDSTRRLLKRFADDLDEFSDQIGEALDDQKWETVERISHRLKGTSGMFGAMKLCNLAEQVNRLCLNGEIGSNQELAVALMKQTREILEEVECSGTEKLPRFLVEAIEGKK
ncbi:MAG: response regulator, partial [Pseudomonadota bacterium]